MTNTSLNKLILAWALCTTLIAVGAVGYIVGKRAGGAVAEFEARPSVADAATDPNAARQPARPAYVVPEELKGIATEWRSEVDDELYGYSVLFDPERRRVIAERCEHHGYASAEKVNAMTDLCQTLLKGTLASLEVDEATLLDRDNQPVQVRLTLDTGSETTSLRLRFDDQDLKLIPGRRNDLIQAIEALPQVQENKRAYLVAMMGPRGNADAPDTER